LSSAWKKISRMGCVFVDGRKDLHTLNGWYKRNPWD
jgi:hypothetical protein